MEPGKPAFAEWAVLELMGHRRLAGFVEEVELAGQGVLRIDIPSEPPVTQFYGVGSMYSLTPTTEAIARGLASRSSPAPVIRYELPAGPSPLTMCCDCQQDIPTGEVAIVVGPGRFRCAECQQNHDSNDQATS